MRAYFYLAAAVSTIMLAELEPAVEALLAAHPQNLSLRYRVQAITPLFSPEASRAILEEEASFGEVHVLLGGRAIQEGNLAEAHRQLTRAHELLPRSASAAMMLAGVAMSYARYPEALALYEQVLMDWPDDVARLAKAKALSYMTPHVEAVAILDELLTDLRTNPGEKFYWRAWNRLHLGQTQAAYDDAMAALNAMRNNEVYRLAGMASLGLNRLTEGRAHFDDALEMNSADCDSHRYLGQIDVAERTLKSAFERYSTAVACYDQVLARLAADLAKHQNDTSGLSEGLIAGVRAEIKEAQDLRAASARSADLISKTPGFRAP